MLEVEDVHTYYGNIHALKGISLTVERGRNRHPDRGQRRRQEHDAQDHLRLLQPREGTSCWTARDLAQCPAPASCEMGVSQVPRAADLSAPDRAGEPGDGRLHRSDGQGESTRTLERVFTSSPACRSASSRWPARCQRRRAADAGHGPGADGATPAAAAGRAVDGPGADPGREHLRHHPGASTTRARPSCWSSRTR